MSSTSIKDRARQYSQERSQSQEHNKYASTNGQNDISNAIARNNFSNSFKLSGAKELGENQSPNMTQKIIKKRKNTDLKNSKEYSTIQIHEHLQSQKLPKIKNPQKNQGIKGGASNKFLPPSSQIHQRLKQQIKLQSESGLNGMRQSSSHFKSFVHSSTNGNLHQSSNATSILRLADESLAMLDQEFKRQENARSTQNNTKIQENLAQRLQESQIQLDQIMNSEELSQNNVSQTLQEPRQQQYSMAFQNSFNTSLVVQSSLLNQQVMESLSEKLNQSNQVFSTFQFKSKLQYIMDSMNELKQGVISKEFQTIVNILQGMVENLVTNLNQKLKQEVSKGKNQQMVLEKLQETHSNLESLVFKYKVELETIKIDKQYLEELQDNSLKQLEQLSFDKANLESQYQESLEQLRAEEKLRQTLLLQEKSAPVIDYDANQSLMESLEKLAEQNNSLNEENRMLQESLEYSKNKQNKLMYLVFKLHKQGYPVNELYELEVKPISTRRFDNDMIEGSQEIGSTEMISSPDFKGESYISFASDESYEGLGLVRVDPKPKPDFVPKLDLIGLPEYVTSDEEQDDQPMQDQSNLFYLQGQKNKNKSY